jgi:hormone-sensitive lipase
LVGDSAGGNLVTAVTIMAIERKFRVPDGLILCYPALNINKHYFTPSFLLALDDPILPYPFLKMCINSYIGKQEKGDALNAESCYLMSPIYVSDKTLKKFPKTRIMSAANDPLRDESFRFTVRLIKN